MKFERHVGSTATDVKFKSNGTVSNKNLFNTLWYVTILRRIGYVVSDIKMGPWSYNAEQGLSICMYFVYIL